MKIGRGIVLTGILSFLGFALVLAVAGTEDNAPSKTVAPEMKASQPERRFDLTLIKRAMPENEQVSELFRPRSWYTPPPPPPVVIAPSPEPSAPSLPFTYIGRMVDGSDVIVFLSRNGERYTIKVGDVLDHTYRVETIGDNNAVLIYLPLNIKQVLAF